MKFFLVKNEPFTFSHDFAHDSNDIKGKHGRFAMKYRVDEDYLDAFDQRISNLLKGMVRHYPCGKHESPFGIDMTLLLVVKVKESKGQSKGQGVLLFGPKKECVLKDIATLFGQDNVRVKVTLSFPPMSNPMKVMNTDNPTDTADNYLTTEEMAVCIDDPVKTCKDSNVQFPKSGILERFLRYSKYIEANLTIAVTVNTTLIRPRPGAIPNQENLLEKMLRDEIHSDFTITAENGSMVKCHKSVLSACSPVFEAMFTADMKESKTCNVDLPEMSEQAVKSFLSYIYSKNEDEPSKNCEIAVELLNAAHKYDVTPDLETAMVNLLLSKPVEWFNVDVGVKIFLLARIIPNNGDALKKRAIQILKENVVALSESEAYVKMFQKDPSGAMELCSAFGSLSPK